MTSAGDVALTTLPVPVDARYARTHAVIDAMPVPVALFNNFPVVFENNAISSTTDEAGQKTSPFAASAACRSACDAIDQFILPHSTVLPVRSLPVNHCFQLIIA